MEFVCGFMIQFFTDLTGIANIQEIIRHFELYQLYVYRTVPWERVEKVW